MKELEIIKTTSTFTLTAVDPNKSFFSSKTLKKDLQLLFMYHFKPLNNKLKTKFLLQCFNLT